MGRTFLNASNQFLTNGNAVVANVPLTLACFVNPSVTNIDQCIMAVGDLSSSGQPTYQIFFGTSNTSICAEAAGSVDDATAKATTVMIAGTWYHCCAVFATTTSRKIYLNGIQEGSSVVTVTTGTMNGSRIANFALSITGAGYAVSGIIAGVGYWNIDLSLAEVQALAAGFSPKLIRPQNLKSYPRMLGGFSPEPDLVGGIVNGSWSLTGTPTFADNMNPRLFNP